MAELSGATDDPADILQTARQLSKFKERSQQTSRDDHIPKIMRTSRAPRVMLLGDSLLERMTTTGQCLSLQPWPSEQMLSKLQLDHINSNGCPSKSKILYRISDAFNAGCGGDKIENILYRLLGNEDSMEREREEPSSRGYEQFFHGMIHTLGERDTQVKLWVVHAGTNNLHKKKGLTDASVDAMRVLLRTLFHISAPETHVLVTALFYRKDIQNELIDQANAKLKEIVDALALEVSCVPTSTHASGKRCASATIGELSGCGRGQFDKPLRATTVDDDGGGKHFHLQIPHSCKIPRIQFLPVPGVFDPEEHLEDHVHLNLGGYQMWMEVLFPMVADMLQCTDDMRYAIEQDG